MLGKLLFADKDECDSKTPMAVREDLEKRHEQQRGHRAR